MLHKFLFFESWNIIFQQILKHSCYFCWEKFCPTELKTSVSYFLQSFLYLFCKSSFKLFCLWLKRMSVCVCVYMCLCGAKVKEEKKKKQVFFQRENVCKSCLFSYPTCNILAQRIKDRTLKFKDVSGSHTDIIFTYI